MHNILISKLVVHVQSHQDLKIKTLSKEMLENAREFKRRVERILLVVSLTLIPWHHGP